MAAFGTYLANELGDHALRNSAYSPPETVYVALHTADPTAAGTGAEVSGGSYARQPIAFDAFSSGATANTSDITFPTATADWGTVTHFAIRDADSGGNLMYFGALTASKAVGTGDVFKFLAGEIDIAHA